MTAIAKRNFYEQKIITVSGKKSYNIQLGKKKQWAQVIKPAIFFLSCQLFYNCLKCSINYIQYVIIFIYKFISFICEHPINSINLHHANPIQVA